MLNLSGWSFPGGGLRGKESLAAGEIALVEFITLQKNNAQDVSALGGKQPARTFEKQFI
jgi:hypothetical protein